MMKKIAITQRLTENVSYFERRDALDLKWAELLSHIGLLPIIIPTSFDRIEKYFEQVKISGVILTGGNSLSSQLDDPLSVLRDKHEKRVIDLSIKHKAPIMGFCRGAQVIAEYFGSNLLRIDNHANTTHRLDVNQNSKYSEYLNSCGTVNSYHDFAIEKVLAPLQISAVSIDGVIESIEHETLPIFGQMWHPERGDPFDKVQMEFINNFFSNN